MVEARFAGDQLILEMQGWDKVLALKDRLEIPTANIRKIKVGISDEDRLGMTDLRMLGTSIPGSVQAGIFRHNGQWVFWDVHNVNSANAVVIDLTGNPYSQVVVEINDPSGLVRQFDQIAADRDLHRLI